nr:hypothetical protein [Chloroflexota bacterium]
MKTSDLDNLYALDEVRIADMLFGKIYERAYAYYRDHRVLNPRRIGAVLEAEVQGTELYSVRVEAREGMILASCTCPFAETAVCKHIGAVLLQWVHRPESFQVVEEEETTVSQPAVAPAPPQEASPLSEQPWWQADEGGAARETKSILSDLIEQLSLNELREIARLREWRIKGSTKADYRTALAPLLVNPTEIARAVTSLPDALREALRAAFVVEEGNGIAPTTLAQAITALRGAAGPVLKPVEAAGLLSDLARWGLLLRWHNSPDGSLRYLFPWEVQRHVPPLLGWCAQIAQAPTDQIQSQKRDDIVHLLYAVWERIAQQPLTLPSPPKPPSRKHHTPALGNWPYEPEEAEIRLGKNREWMNSLQYGMSVPASVRLLDDAVLSELAPLTGGDVEEVEFLCHLLCDLELVSGEKGYLLARPALMNDFLSNPKHRQYAWILQTYLSMQRWSELDMLLRADRRLTLWRRPIPFFTYEQFRFQLLRMRHILLRFLATAGEEGWCLLADMEAALRLLWPHFSAILDIQRQTWLQNLWGLSWRGDKRELKTENEQDWRAAQGGFLRALLTGPLFWLGFVELSRKDGELVAVRMHGLADWMWNRPSPAPEELPLGEPVTIDEANLAIVVHPGTVPPQAHTLLGRIARLEEATPTRFVYRLDMRTAYATFERGELLDDLLGTWEKVMPVPFPASLREALAEWWARYGQVRLYEGFALLELGDDIALLELEASTPLREYIVAKLSPRLVLVAEDAVDELLQAFTTKGYTPKEMR